MPKQWDRRLLEAMTLAAHRPRGLGRPVQAARRGTPSLDGTTSDLPHPPYRYALNDSPGRSARAKSLRSAELFAGVGVVSPPEVG